MELVQRTLLITVITGSDPGQGQTPPEVVPLFHEIESGRLVLRGIILNSSVLRRYPADALDYSKDHLSTRWSFFLNQTYVKKHHQAIRITEKCLLLASPPPRATINLSVNKKAPGSDPAEVVPHIHDKIKRTPPDPVPKTVRRPLETVPGTPSRSTTRRRISP